jgi:hypothetical protein
MNRQNLINGLVARKLQSNAKAFCQPSANPQAICINRAAICVTRAAKAPCAFSKANTK